MPTDVDDVSAQSITLSTLLGGDHRFEVPDYQRQYSWEIEQLQRFWKDIQNLDQESESHFLGSVLLIKRDTGFGERDVYEVVDGQQRLATVSILFAVIRERLEGDVKRSKLDGLEKYLFDTDASGNKEQNLKLNPLDNDDFKSIINGNTPPNQESNLWQAAEFFANKISSSDINDIEQIRDKVLEGMPIVLIETYDQDSAFLLFETLNDRGMELSNIDLMKNALLKTADEADTEYEPVRQNWEKTVSELRYDIDKPERFFRHYLMFSPQLDVKESVSRRTITDTFEEIIQNIDEYDRLNLENLTDDIYEKARLYKNIVDSNINRYETDANKAINRRLSQLNEFGSTQERTLILYILSQVNNETKAVRGLSLVESYNVRRVIASSETGSSVNQFYATTCSNMSQSESPIETLQSELTRKTVPPEEFRIAMERTDFTRSSRTRYFLIKYEEYLSSNKIGVNGEIEHIAPRSAFDANKYSSWMSYLDIGKDRFEEIKDKIGNLTLIEKRLNIEAGNNPFEEKRDQYSESGFEMTQNLTNYSDWSEEKIQDRTEELAKLAPQIWNLE